MKPFTNAYSIAASRESKPIPASTFWRQEDDSISSIALFVEHKILFCDTELLEWTKSSLSGRFRVKDFGDISLMLRVEAIRNRQAGTLSLRQLGYVRETLEHFGMLDCNPTPIPMQPKLNLLQWHYTPESPNPESQK